MTAEERDKGRERQELPSGARRRIAPGVRAHKKERGKARERERGKASARERETSGNAALALDTLRLEVSLEYKRPSTLRLRPPP